MSLFGSLTTAVSGLDAQQDALGNISNNIANSQTVGYKDVDTSFQELVTQSNANYNAPGGVTAAPIYLNGVAGSLAASQTTTNLAVSGNGFFVVKAPPSTTTSGALSFNSQDLYTRAGDFSLDKNSYLVNSAGYYLEGYTVDPATGATNTSSVQPVQISQQPTPPQATSNVDLSVNLPSNQTLTAGSAGYTSPSPVTQTVYDAQGNPYTMSIQYDYLGSGKTSGASGDTGLDEWQAAVTVSPSTGNGGTSSPYIVNMFFNNGTQPSTGSKYPSGTLNSITGLAADSSYYNAATGTTATGTNADSSSISLSGDSAASPLFNFQVGSGNSPLPISLNLGTFDGNAATNTSAASTSGTTSATEYNGTTVNVQSLKQDGFEAGAFQGVSIDSNGYVSASYSNGATRKYYQVPLAQFNASQGLSRASGSVFESTADSGSANLSVSGQNGAGTISPSEIEQSNVNIASEFTKLIVAQQAYSANSKVITTANNLLSSLLSIVQ